jgi:membrane-bound lytic murein transglycosylase B
MATSVEAEFVGHGLPTDEKMLAMIGTIALRHGQLDNALKMIIKDLSGIEHEEALDATARVGSRELRDRVRKLARQRLGEGTALLRLQALLTRAERATDKRNELMHAVWGTELDGGPVMSTDNHEFRPVPTVTELQEMEYEIIIILEDLISARHDGFLLEALKKPPRKPQSRAKPPP